MMKPVETYNVDWDGDWELETRFKSYGGADNSPNKLVWDKGFYGQNAMYFGYTTSGYFRIDEYNDGYNNILDYTSASYISKTGYNKLTVRKVSNTYYFFFNEVLIKSTDYIPVENNYIGIQTAPNGTVEVDYIKLVKLEKSTAPPSSEFSYSSKTEIESLLIGSWSVQSGKTVDELKTIKFGPDNYVTMIDNRGTTGGPDYYRNGTKFDLKYDIVKDGKTTELDINIYREEERVGIMKALIIFKSKNEADLAMNFGEDLPRPTSIEDPYASIAVNIKKDSSLPEDPKTAYNYYSEDEKLSLYTENFDAPISDWSGQISGKVSNNIQNGHLVYSSLNDKSYNLKHELMSWEKDWDRDWELEMRVRSYGGDENSLSSIMWGVNSSTDKLMNYGFTSSGYYRIDEVDDGINNIVDYTPASFVSKTGHNKLTVRKVGKTYYFFFNDQLVKTTDYIPVKGDYIGFSTPQGGTLEVDYIKLSKLKKGGFTPIPDEGSYSHYAEYEKQSSYLEDFNTPNENWEQEKTGAYSSTIQNGSLVFSSFDNQDYTYPIDNRFFSWDGDWELEAQIKKVSGSENSAADLVWNRPSDGSKGMFFGFNGLGNYYIRESDNGNKMILNATPASFVSKTEFNKLTIRKVDKTYYFFFNDRLVKSMDYSPITGNFIGMQVSKSSTIAIDYIKLSKIRKGGFFHENPEAKYTFYSNADKSQFLHLDYNEPSSETEHEKAGAYRSTVKNGAFNWSSLEPKSRIWLEEIKNMDWSKDWQMETEMKFVQGSESEPIEFSWNYAQSFSVEHHFGFTANGSFQLRITAGTNEEITVPLTATQIVNKTDFNKLTVRKVGEVVYYFLNERLVSAEKAYEIKHNEVSFSVPGNTTMQIDYLDVAYLDKTAFGSSFSFDSASDIESLLIGKWYGKNTYQEDDSDETWQEEFLISIGEYGKKDIKFMHQIEMLGTYQTVDNNGFYFKVIKPGRTSEVDLIYDDEGEKIIIQCLIHFKGKNEMEFTYNSEGNLRPTDFGNLGGDVSFTLQRQN